MLLFRMRSEIQRVTDPSTLQILFQIERTKFLKEIYKLLDDIQFELGGGGFSSGNNIQHGVA